MQAFIEQARWLHAYHEKRSDTVGLRAANVLPLVGVTAALLPHRFILGEDKIDFTNPIRTTVLALLALLRIILGKARPFTSPRRGPSTGSDHCSAASPTNPHALLAPVFH